MIVRHASRRAARDRATPLGTGSRTAGSMTGWGAGIEPDVNSVLDHDQIQRAAARLHEERQATAISAARSGPLPASTGWHIPCATSRRLQRSVHA